MNEQQQEQGQDLEQQQEQGQLNSLKLACQIEELMPTCRIEEVDDDWVCWWTQQDMAASTAAMLPAIASGSSEHIIPPGSLMASVAATSPLTAVEVAAATADVMATFTLTYGYDSPALSPVQCLGGVNAVLRLLLYWSWPPACTSFPCPSTANWRVC